MARYKNNRIQKVKFKDIADFSEGVYDLELTDILNDAVKSKTFDNFIESPGAFEYELDLTVDEEKVIELGVLGFKVEFFSKNPNNTIKVDRQNNTRSQIAKKRKSNVRNFLLTKSPASFFSFNIDLNIPLPSNSFQFLSNKMYLPKPKTYTSFFMLPPETGNKKQPTQITATPIKSIVKNSGIGLSFKGYSKQSVLKKGLDPAMMLAKPTPFIPTLSAQINKASVPLDDPPPKDQIDRVAFNTMHAVKSLMDEREKLRKLQDDDSNDAQKLSNLASSNRLSENSLVNLGYKATIENSLFTVKRIIELPKDLLGMKERFWVRITPILKKENTLFKINKQTLPIIFSVNHKSKVEEILVPEYAPEVSLVLDKKGVVILRLTQKDPTASSVSLVRSVISPRKSDFSKPTIVANLKFTSDDPSKIITDFDPENIFPNTVIYRAISKSGMGQLGPSASYVIKGHVNVNMPTAKEDPNALAIIAINENERIKIDVEKIPDEVIGIRLLREEIDETGSLDKRVQVIPTNDGKTLNDTFGGVSKLTYFDYSADLYKRYRYFCAMRPTLGGEFISEEDEHIIRRKPVRPLPVEVSLSNTQVGREESGGFRVSIDAISLPKPEGIDFILNVMEKAGVDQVLVDEIKKSRSELAELAVFVVERIDRVTGKRISFGLHAPGTFEDNDLVRKRLKIPGLMPSGRYSYFFKLCLRPPQSFLRDVFVNAYSAQNAKKSIKANAKKFLGAFAQSTGAIPSNKDIEDLSPGDMFRLGETGITLQVDVQTPKPLPKPVELRGRNIKTGRHKGYRLYWKSSIEDTSDVDYCLIFVTINDKSHVAGTVACSGAGMYFKFKDTKFGSQVGKKTYTVKFVYRDSSVSAPSNKETHTTYTNLPKAFFAKKKKIKILGDFKGLVKKQKIFAKGKVAPKSMGVSNIAKAIGAPGWTKKF